MEKRRSSKPIKRIECKNENVKNFLLQHSIPKPIDFSENTTSSFLKNLEFQDNDLKNENLDELKKMNYINHIKGSIFCLSLFDSISK